MEKLDWQNFWANYRCIESQEETDLFYQVGKTINKKPISEFIFRQMVKDIILQLQLNDTDVLLEMCCGNGLLTKPLSEFSGSVYAFDFTKHLIETAKKFKQKDNVIYKVGDAKSDFFKIFDFQKKPTKYLMNDSLGYFTQTDLENILALIISNSKSFKFYITGIPTDSLKWNFYNTEDRKKTYLNAIKNGDETNNGMGKWWAENEFSEIAKRFNLKLTLSNQPKKISNYRTNVLFESE